MYELFATHGFGIALALFGSGALLSLAFDSKHGSKEPSITAHTFAALGSVFGFLFGVLRLIEGVPLSLHLPLNFGIMPHILSVTVDPLSAFFIAAISGVAFAASLFGIGYQKQFYGVLHLGNFGFFYNLFIASMILVVSADNAFLFLAAWELMALATYFLVVFERHHGENIRAGTLYILMTQFGTVFLFIAFLLLYRFAGAWDFDAMRAVVGTIPFAVQQVILACALVGFATKAGVIPLHIWLPEAHPAAPSHVSALMSGVMIKTAIFMIIRFFFDFFPDQLLAWGLIILALGALSSLLGVLYALSEHDIKRLLAYHSVENIGIILLGLGAAITFFSYDMTIPGIIALAAALYHTANHAIFKSLLFLAAGSVVHATKTRNMEEYGGLIKLLPWTAVFFLVGAIAISGLPPFNGFVSEWLTFQALFAGVSSLPLIPKIVFLAAAIALAFTGGLAAACFVKAFGVTFLARPRHEHKHAHECSAPMLTGMSLLAVSTLIFGLGAGMFFTIFAQIAARFVGAPSEALTILSPFTSISLGSVADLSMPFVALALLAGLIFVYAGTQIWARRQKVTISRTWDCGASLTPRMEMTATAFSRSILVVFKKILFPKKIVTLSWEGGAMNAYFGSTTAVSLTIPDLYRTYFYDPASAAVIYLARHIKRIQSGSLNMYLLYMFLTLLALLSWALFT